MDRIGLALDRHLKPCYSIKVEGQPPSLPNSIKRPMKRTYETNETEVQMLERKYGHIVNHPLAILARIAIGMVIITQVIIPSVMNIVGVAESNTEQTRY